MKRLGIFVRLDAYAVKGRDKKPVVKEVVIESQHVRVQSKLVKDARLVEQGIYTARAESFKRVAATGAGGTGFVGAGQAVELFLCLSYFFFGKGIRDNDISVLENVVNLWSDLLQSGALSRRAHGDRAERSVEPVDASLVDACDEHTY